jgi:hypothetical protein
MMGSHTTTPGVSVVCSSPDKHFRQGSAGGVQNWGGDGLGPNIKVSINKGTPDKPGFGWVSEGELRPAIRGNGPPKGL